MHINSQSGVNFFQFVSIWLYYQMNKNSFGSFTKLIRIQKDSNMYNTIRIIGICESEFIYLHIIVLCLCSCLAVSWLIFCPLRMLLLGVFSPLLWWWWLVTCEKGSCDFSRRWVPSLFCLPHRVARSCEVTVAASKMASLPCSTMQQTELGDDGRIGEGIGKPQLSGSYKKLPATKRLQAYLLGFANAFPCISISC